MAIQSQMVIPANVQQILSDLRNNVETAVVRSDSINLEGQLSNSSSQVRDLSLLLSAISDHNARFGNKITSINLAGNNLLDVHAYGICYFLSTHPEVGVVSFKNNRLTRKSVLVYIRGFKKGMPLKMVSFRDNPIEPKALVDVQNFYATRQANNLPLPSFRFSQDTNNAAFNDLARRIDIIGNSSAFVGK